VVPPVLGAVAEPASLHAPRKTGVNANTSRFIRISVVPQERRSSSPEIALSDPQLQQEHANYYIATGTALASGTKSQKMQTPPPVRQSETEPVVILQEPRIF
jgi:hypothetical protein